MVKVLHISDAALERRLERLMKRIIEAQDTETQRVLWADYNTELHRQRSAEKVMAMEKGWIGVDKNNRSKGNKLIDEWRLA